MARSVVLILAASLAAVAPARAEPPRPRTTYVEIDSGRATVLGGPVEQALLFVNRCPGGCALTPGYEDSRTNRSSIIDGPVFIPELDATDQTWDAIVGCVRAMYSDFDIVVTDEDPGDAPHFEAIVAGKPTDAGFALNVGGVAPFTCGVIDNAITFTFAAVYGNKPQQICHTIAQESAHAFGLDHELLCEDPMTYLSSCGTKCFQDADADCGESGPRQCSCGGSRQNSWQRISELFGPSATSGESLRIFGPTDGTTVQAGFHVEVAVAVTCIATVEVWVGEAYLGTVDIWPYIFDTPLDLPEGPATIHAIATDADGNTLETTISVTVTAAPEPEPMPEPVDAGIPAVGEPDSGVDCGCSSGAPGNSDSERLGALLLVASVVLTLRRRRAR